MRQEGDRGTLRASATARSSERSARARSPMKMPPAAAHRTWRGSSSASARVSASSKARRGALRVARQQEAEAGLRAGRPRPAARCPARARGRRRFADLEQALRIAAHGRRLEGEAEQVEGGRAVDGATACAPPTIAPCDVPGRPATMSSSPRIRGSGGAARGIVELGVGAREQARGVLHAARRAAAPAAASSRSPRRVGSELGRALERARRRRGAAARLCPVARSARARRRRPRRAPTAAGRAVPGAPASASSTRRPAPRDGAALARRGGAVDGRAHERVAELAARSPWRRSAPPARRASNASRGRPSRVGRAEHGAELGASSAAASTSSRCVASGSGRSGPGTRPRSRPSAARRRAAARGPRAGRRQRAGSSISASGLPCVTLTSWWRTRSGQALVEQRRGVAGRPARSRRARRAASRRPSSRAPRTAATGRRAGGGRRTPARRRRRRSSQCASSTTHSSGPSSATAASRPSSASETRKRSVDALAGQPEARRAARRAWRPGERVGAVEHRPQQLVQAGEGQLALRLDARRRTARACRPRARRA